MNDRFETPTSGELLDVVDITGEPTGEVMAKSIVHRAGLWHRDGHAFITNGTDVLQQQRAWDKLIMPGAWDISVGCHVAHGETGLDAVMRETEEELGLTLPAERFIYAGRLAVEMAMEGGAWTHRTVGENFVVVTPDLSLDALHLQDSEVIGARWYPIDQLEADLEHPETAALHAPQPRELWALGIAAMRQAVA